MSQPALDTTIAVSDSSSRALRTLTLVVSALGAAAALLLGTLAALGVGGIEPIGRVAALGVAIAWFGASAAGPSYYAALAARSPGGARRVLLIVSLTQAFSLALAVAAVSRNLAVTWVSLEATTITGAFLVASGDDRRHALEAAWKFAVLCFAGVGFGLIGIGLLSASTGGAASMPTNLDSIAAIATRLDPKLLALAMAALLVGFGTKAGLFPLHWWLPDAHSQSPTPVSALMSGGLVATSLAVIVKVFAALHGVPVVEAFRPVLIGSGLLGLVVASFSMIDQRDVKRLLAFSTIENVSLMAIAAGIGSPLAIAAFSVHLLAHAALKTSAFLSVGALVAERASRSVDDLAGAIARRPVDASVFALSAAALVAFPPSPLFVSELLLVFAALQAGMAWLAVLVVVLLSVAFVALTQRVVAIVLGSSRPHTAAGHRLGLAYSLVSLAPLAFAVGVIVLRPPWLMELVRVTAVVVTGGLPW